ncbi:hypothetical protein ACS127_13465 [Amphibacillus sp. Q70]|uniref:hypothetical protein n=1 Tax=Amphibacillus sp. Q70 TaxID=3453416 RepID=UPI003F82D4FA
MNKFIIFKAETKEVLILQVKMLVQTQYKSRLLRRGKTYEVPDETAKRWNQAKIAIILSGGDKK